ncbi:Hypothetical_protein [Hexamita inflata]|uniref:Hypothetical_protein n=1 Tax=Hexamita inflata TaxID=28002 RepID=A0AA86UI19_9EUKA|nr:Hypothetical protein HINF_LOCUS46635 [Hexamita inflata]
MIFLYSIQVDQFNISNIHVEKLQLKFDFSTTAFPGAELYVSINAQLPDSQLIFVQKVVVDTQTKTSVSMICEDQILLAQCTEQLSSLKKNILVAITFDQSYYRYTIYKLKASVDTCSNSTQVVIIIGCSVGGVVLIALLVVLVIFLKRRKNRSQPLLAE